MYQATDIEANFDFNEVKVKMIYDDFPEDKGGGVQQDYLEKLVEQLRLELNRGTKNREQQWLLCHLRAQQCPTIVLKQVHDTVNNVFILETATLLQFARGVVDRIFASFSLCRDYDNLSTCTACKEKGSSNL